MAVSTNSAGSLEFASTGEVFRHLLAISNELATPKVLVCRSDPIRSRSTNFATLSNVNLSYFIGLDAFETAPLMILSGDRNLSTNSAFLSGVLTVNSNTPLRWTKDMHVHQGNIGLADGSAQQVTDNAFTRQIASSTNLPERLAIP